MGAILRFIARASLVLAVVITFVAIFFNVNLAAPAVDWIVANTGLTAAHAQGLPPATADAIARYQNLVLIGTILILLVLSVLISRHKRRELHK